MFSVGASLRLPVPIGRVWRLLVDVDRYADWHPTLRFTDRPGDDERVGYVYSPRGKQGPEFASEGRITGLDWLTSFSWRTGTRGLLVIEESYELEKLGQGVEVTHRLVCRGIFSWLGYPVLRRVCSVFLKRSNMALEQHFRRMTVQSRYARPSGRRA
ncbi:SRPBCC family protein [Sphingopyxis sp. R3-92]|uniref:SRPBCC family protein n=1 Tax=Sphingopyxis sp. R3-92 TaxID=3158553 RepID=UPI003EE6DCF7